MKFKVGDIIMIDNLYSLRGPWTPDYAMRIAAVNELFYTLEHLTPPASLSFSLGTEFVEEHCHIFKPTPLMAALWDLS